MKYTVTIIASQPKPRQKGIGHLMGKVYKNAESDDNGESFTLNEPSFGGKIVVQANEVAVTQPK
jgi:hypothetical protein